MGKLIKSFSDNFTMIHNDILDDERLHLKSVGLFMHLWRQPDNWSFYLNEVTKHHKDGLDATRSAAEELERYGYLKRIRGRNEKGQFGDSDWLINDQPSKNVDLKAILPKLENPTWENPTLENPIQEKPTLLSTDSTKDLTKLSTDCTNLSRAKNASRAREKKSKPKSKFDKSTCKWAKQTNQPLVDYAVGIAKERASDKRNELSYFESVMNDWTNNGIKTVKEAKQYVDNKQSNYSYHVRKAFEPAWLDKPAKPVVDDVDEEKVRELKERIKRRSESNKN